VKISRTGIFSILMVFFFLFMGSFVVHANDDWDEDWAESKYDGPDTPSAVQNIPDSVKVSPTTSTTAKKINRQKFKKRSFVKRLR